MPTADRHGILHNIQKTRRNILRIENAQPDDDQQPGRMNIDPGKLSRRRATAKRARTARRRQRQGRGS